MYPLFETINLDHNYLLQLEYHNHSVNNTRNRLYGSTANWDIGKMIDIPELNPDKIYRCRFLYSKDSYMTEFIPYLQRIIAKLYLIQDHELDYSCKYTDRSRLDGLRKQLITTTDSDVVIVKHGLITDTSFANIAFSDGKKWYTPNSPLLKGTKRAFYLTNGMLTERTIRPVDLSGFARARLINAMLDLETGHDIAMDNIDHSSF